jgi:hypothetical protein
MRFILPLLLAGCAPVYVPNLVRAPMLEQAGDLHLAAHAGLHGAQLDAAYAPGEVLGVRAGAHVQYGQNVSYQLGTLGVGTYHATPSGLRVAGWLDAGVGHGRGRSEITITSNNSQTTSIYVLQGALFQLCATLEGGWENENLAAGGELRLIEHLVLHDAASEADQRLADLTTIEPVGFVRVGAESVKVQFFTGLTLPLRVSGEVGVPWPVLGGVGLVWDFNPR